MKKNRAPKIDVDPARLRLIHAKADRYPNLELQNYEDWLKLDKKFAWKMFNMLSKHDEIARKKTRSK